MSSKLPLLMLLLVACSGSAGSEILCPTAAEPADDPNTFVTNPPDEQDGATLQKEEKPQGVEDAGSDVEAGSDAASDASVDTAPDAAEDGSQPDSGGPDASLDAETDAAPPTPRFGVTFNGQNDATVAAQVPLDIAGQTSVTLEAWWRLNAATDRGNIFHVPHAYCAVTTGGPATIHCCAWQAEQQTCVVSPVVALQGTWYHVAWVLSAGSWTLFVNGQKQGDVPSVFQAYPAIPTEYQPGQASHAFFGADRPKYDHAPVCTIDEFRMTYSALYTASFAPPKHLDAAGAMNLLFDEGTGTTSGPATLYGGASWVAVSR